MAYEGDDPKMIEELPFKIIPGEVASYRDSIFLERAVVGERLPCGNGNVIKTGHRACTTFQRRRGECDRREIL